MAAENGGAADLDGAHDARLVPRQSVSRAVGFAVSSKNIGQLDGWSGRGPRLLAGAAFAERIQRTDDAGDELRRDGGIARRGVDTAVAQQHLDDADTLAYVPYRFRFRASEWQSCGAAYGR
jgi:hypothetical protein